MARADTIVIAIDQSQFSQDAFKWYAEHMHKSVNKVTLVHCMEMPSVPSRDTWENQTKVGRQKGKELQETFEDLIKDYGIAVKFAMDFEKPGEYIVHIAKEEHADVIIMGTRGMGKVRRTILGSVSNYVLNHADLPVLICRSGKE